MSESIAHECTKFIEKQALRQNFQNFYRCIKTLNLLRNLFINEAITHEQYLQQEKQMLGRVKMLTQILKKQNQDVQRFCELWEIKEQYETIKQGRLDESSHVRQKSSMVDISVVWVVNKTHQINDTLELAETVGDIVVSLSFFTNILEEFKQRQKKLTPLMIQTIDQLAEEQTKLKQRNIKERLTADDKEHLKDMLTKFSIEFNKLVKL